MQHIRHIAFSNVLPRILPGRCLSTSTVLSMPQIKVNDTLPSVDLYEGDPGSKINTKDAFGKGKYIIVAVPGAFTPTCNDHHLPGYIQDMDKLKAKGVDSVCCISVNDPFVMAAWGEKLKAKGKVRMLADTGAEFTKAIEMQMDIPPLGGIRSKRYAMVVKDGVVTEIEVEPDGTGLTCSKAPEILKKL